LRLCADAGAGGADRVHHAARGLRRAGRAYGPRAHARGRARLAAPQKHALARRQSLAARHGARRGGAMSGGPARRLLPDGRRLHLQHGPIDLVIEAWGERAEIAAAYAQAWQRFAGVLPELVGELALLRRAADRTHPGVEGKV